MLAGPPRGRVAWQNHNFSITITPAEVFARGKIAHRPWQVNPATCLIEIATERGTASGTDREGEKVPGYLELNPAFHCGESTKGEFLAPLGAHASQLNLVP